MRAATIILSLFVLGFTSCSAPRTLIQNSRTDSVGIDRKVDIRTRIEYVPIIVHIPDQRASAIIEPSDTSHLETDYAVSDAFVRPDGKLYHDLRNKPQQKPINVPVEVTDTTTTQKIERQKRERIEIPVPMPLTWWQRFWLTSGKIGWGLLAGAIIGIIIRKRL